MPVKRKKVPVAQVEPKLVRGRMRTVLLGTKTPALNENGKPRDGGGWANNAVGRGKARRQSGHINPDPVAPVQRPKGRRRA